ncbi:hypothetical protein [Anaerorhabdus furcosa]|uniref:Tetratricopeptide repeat-containing protein n=1 Tax=Anaerorhabdus furcosa TaxID=118967 RepID=A0A1T4QA93_9FIRM|nr:hypothetical protein [Anaerorhabdus furcosa]SKA00441.1 hypothetical protein SAMN02745191_2363 [Anaerorhabdus furcosa]
METINTNEALGQLCQQVKQFLNEKKYSECEAIIRNAMQSYPHAPQPHNLLGLLLEDSGEHPIAMKHFRAAWALDPSYLPARVNLEIYGTFSKCHTRAFDENDCIENKRIRKKYSLI